MLNKIKTIHGAVGMTLALFMMGMANANPHAALKTLDQLDQTLTFTKESVEASVKGQLTGNPGDRFVLLGSPAVLTEFTGAGLELIDLPPLKKGTPARKGILIRPDEIALPIEQVFEFSFSYKSSIGGDMMGYKLPTSRAFVQKVVVKHSHKGFYAASSQAVSAEHRGNMSTLKLTPMAMPFIQLAAKRPDRSKQELKLFVDASQLYLPSLGVIDGIHHLSIRPTQGEVSQLVLDIPKGFTVGEVSGPVGQWQFDPSASKLTLPLTEKLTQAFDIKLKTQKSLSDLPTEAQLSGVSVQGAAGETGLLGLAFANEAQLEKAEAEKLSPINLADFPQMLPKGHQAAVQRAYRYGKDGGALKIRVAPVEAEVRVTTRQVLSVGDEQSVFSIKGQAEVSRTGIFTLSFPLPKGFEVESLTGERVGHWTEVSKEGGKGERQVVLHLKGKTLGTIDLNLTLATPTDKLIQRSEKGSSFTVPEVRFDEATRQSGELVINPARGIRLRTLERKNISEMDSRDMGGRINGSLAYRLLQEGWQLKLGVEQLDPWITGKVLHELIVREGQTKTNLTAHLLVEMASVRSVRFLLDGLSEEEKKTVRASGSAVSEIAPVPGSEDFWEVKFKRRIYGKTLVQIEYERTGERTEESETLREVSSPDLRQVSYYMVVRAGSRLELKPEKLSRGWQAIDWSSLPVVLRDARDRSTPTLSFRVNAPKSHLQLNVRRHAVADALKMRVEKAELTTVISPLGETLTGANLEVELVQRGSLRLSLPKGAELYNVFVNDRGTRIVREGNDYLFYIEPDATRTDDREMARVEFYYAMKGEAADKVRLLGPRMNLPLENIEWRVVTASDDQSLEDSSGDLQKIEEEVFSRMSKESYFSKLKGAKDARWASQMGKFKDVARYQAEGNVQKAEQVLNSLANQSDLDDASNEDARVQLDELQKKKVTLALQTRRQRIYLDNRLQDESFARNGELEIAANQNPLFAGDLNFKPNDISNLLMGNTQSENDVLKRIASRITAHQHASEPAPKNLTIDLPEESRVYTFKRTVQVKGDEALELNLDFADRIKRNSGGGGFLLGLIMAAALVITLIIARRHVIRVA